MEHCKKRGLLKDSSLFLSRLGGFELQTTSGLMSVFRATIYEFFIETVCVFTIRSHEYRKINVIQNESTRCNFDVHNIDCG